MTTDKIHSLGMFPEIGDYRKRLFYNVRFANGYLIENY